MDLQRQEYPALLATLQPTQAVSILNDRVKLIGLVNSSIADWLQERRRIEEQYAQALTKLARRPQQDGGAALGIFQMPWQRIVSATETLAQAHSNLASKIDSDVEAPLRQYSSKSREMQSMSTIQGNLSALARDFDNAQKKADKLKEKGAKASAGKVASATSSIDDANQQWESQAPYVFEQLQAADESRLNHLRDVLTQLETHEVDLVEKNRVSAESCLNALLNVETADEIKTFATKVGGGRTSVTRRERRESTSGPTPDLPPRPPPAVQTPDDAASSVSGVSAGARPRLAPPPVPESHRQSTFGALKRLGTVMGRRKSSPQTAQTTTSEKPDKAKKSRPSFAPFRRENSSRSFQEVASPPLEGLTSTASQDESSLSPPRSQQTESENQPHEMAAIAEVPSPKTDPRPMTNGSAPERASSLGQPSEGANAITANGFLPPSEPPKEANVTGLTASTNPFDAISQAQREATAINTESESALQGLTIRDKPIEEDQSEAQLAMNNVASQLRMQAQQSGISRAQGSVRGRRDVRNTIFVPSNETPESVLPTMTTSPGAITTSPISSNAAQLAPPLKRSGTPGTIPEDQPVSTDGNSIHSSQTAPSVATLPTHPELQNPGLNASIIETVSTWMTSGSVIKSTVVGEIALVYNVAPSESAPGSSRVRLDSFQILEKVAANPSFVTSSASEKGKETEEERAGQYQIALSSISKPSPTVAFKYQLHTEDSNLSAYSPIIFHPVWQIQDAQASVIINYSLNPLIRPQIPPQSLTFKNVLVTINIDTTTSASSADLSTTPTQATKALMAPTAGASFKRKQALVVWRLPELTVSADAEPANQRFLARFITTGPKAGPGKVEAKWEITKSASSLEPSVASMWVGSHLGVSVLESGSGTAETDPFADEASTPGAATGMTGTAQKWRELGVSESAAGSLARKIVSGRYTAN